MTLEDILKVTHDQQLVSIKQAYESELDDIVDFPKHFLKICNEKYLNSKVVKIYALGRDGGIVFLVDMRLDECVSK